MRQAALDYVEALYRVDTPRVVRSVHPGLVKYGYYTRDGAYGGTPMTYDERTGLAARRNRDPQRVDPDTARKDVAVFEGLDKTASARVTARWGRDYMHLVKTDGGWTIRQILWQSHPPTQSPAALVPHTHPPDTMIARRRPCVRADRRPVGADEAGAARRRARRALRLESGHRGRTYRRGPRPIARGPRVVATAPSGRHFVLARRHTRADIERCVRSFFPVPIRSVLRPLLVSLLTALLFVVASGPQHASAQDPPTDAAAPEPFAIEGHWTGAYVRDGTTQRVTASVTVATDTPRVALTNEEWAYFGGRDPVPVTRTDDGRLAFDTHYGPARVDVDSTYRELVGVVGDHEPAIEIHLKKSALSRPAPSPQTTEVAFESGDATLRGTVVTPSTPGPHPALVYVPGRGCASRGGGLRRLRWLAERGVAGLAYDNRGAGASDGSCKASTLETESRDLRAALQALAGRDDIDAGRIGLWGNSAAGWYIPHAVTRSDVDVAFVVEKVGPATSVEAQQTDNARLIAEQMGLAPADSAKMLRYVDLMFAADRPNDAVFAEMQDLLAHGDRTGWADQFLVRDPAIGDVPATAAGLDSLWARRYAYDPVEDLRRMDMPMLVFYGAMDRIVPPAPNAPLMRRLLAGNDDARVVVVPEAGHGLGQGSAMRTLSTPDGRYDTHYWKFYRPAPDFIGPLLRFLDEHALRDDG